MSNNDPRALEDLDRLVALQPLRFHFYEMRFDYFLAAKQYREALTALMDSEKAGTMSSESASNSLLKFVKDIPQILAENKLDQADVAGQILGWLDVAAHSEPMDENAHYNHACIKSLQAEILATRRLADAEKVPEAEVAALVAESLKHLKIYLVEFKGNRTMAEQDRDLEYVRGLSEYSTLLTD